ncbi:MAG: GspH/FimT family pseudopilin [Gammaproteobacteria bacterium]
MKNQRGISFIELIFALSVAGVLVSAAVPSFLGSIRNSDMASSANSLVGAVHAARAEAVKTRSRVTMCRGDRSGENPTCDADGFDLLVFVNDSNDASYDSGDVLVRASSWLKEDMTVSSNDIPDYVTFNSRGVTEDTNGDSISGTALLCGPSGEKHARIITLSPTGRPTVQHHRDATNPAACPTTT